ncbi:transcriptional regulator, partial [Burkholderia pseudomallei]|nr:transcriptional regulator [Burkholderia pseudomallei]MBF3605506.1 transcriptional regulator [Burkholderia pseudomallei]
LTNEQIGDAAQLLRHASGLYDTAARAAASL